uniref:N-acetylneuraminate lyase n=1 Tax=Clastoptera arizonana TaxID=38151 RepID=A0A1B6CQ74_9HEMI
MNFKILIILNGTVGEGVCMTASERKLVAEVWVKASNKTGQTIMVQIGGTCLKHVKELAKHAETIGASAILCLAELFHRPQNVDQLVSYLQEVGKSAPNTPLLYYHYPSITGINLDMHEFLQEGAKKIPTLAGIKFTHTNLEEGAHCLNVQNGDFGVFLGNDQIMAAAFLLGFDSLIATTLNIMPEKIIKIQKCVKEGNNSEALRTQQELVKIILTITKYGGWVPTMKVAMHLMTGFDFGEPRKPQTALTEQQINDLRKDLEALNLIKK